MSCYIEVDWDIDPEDVGRSKYDSYRVIGINLNEATKEIWSITYTYIWNCGDGCCSSTERDIAYVGSITEHLKKRLLERLPDYKLQSICWG